jgi:hypothetical protein
MGWAGMERIKIEDGRGFGRAIRLDSIAKRAGRLSEAAREFTSESNTMPQNKSKTMKHKLKHYGLSLLTVCGERKENET